MAQRTGTNLKADMAAADTALATAITSPTDVNIAAAVTAFQTVETNGRDSRYTITRTGLTTGMAKDVGIMARHALRDLNQIVAKTPFRTGAYDTQFGGALGNDVIRSDMLRRIQGALTSAGWARYRDLPTTD